MIQDDGVADLTLVSCGSNLHHVVTAAKQLRSDSIRCRIISCPSFDLFGRQSDEYQQSGFPLDGKPIVSVEEYVATTWARYVTASIEMASYGYSASNESNYGKPVYSNYTSAGGTQQPRGSMYQGYSLLAV